MAVSASTFHGFEPAAIDFMAELAANNERSWFQPRKAEFERLVKEPFEALVAELAERFESRRIPLRADPGHSIFRIYRDTRFSKDKSPYKTHLGASFPWMEPSADGFEVVEPQAHGNGGYFNFEPGGMYVGGGMWMPDRSRLERFRRVVLDEPERVRAAIEEPGFVAAFGSVTAHETYKRLPADVPADIPVDHPMADLLRYKDVVFGRPLSDAEVTSPRLPDTIADAFAAGMPVLRLLSTIRA